MASSTCKNLGEEHSLANGEGCNGIRKCNRSGLTVPKGPNLTIIGVPKTVLLVNRAFVPPEKKRVFDENGENDESAF